MGIMGRFRDFLSEEKEEKELIDDDVTTDNFLKSLRRQRRVQLEQVEKEKLINTIKDHERDMTRRNIFGFKDNLEKKKKLLQTKKKILESKILQQKQFMFEKQRTPKKTEYKSIFFK